MLGLFFATLFGGQCVAGRHEYNDERARQGESPLGYWEYLGSAHFAEATSENWESEFFQMGVFVLGTAFLFQVGSAESKDPRKKPTQRRIGPNSPWAARRGGWIRRVYEHSLSLAMFGLFLLSFIWHAFSGRRLFNEERARDGESAIGLGDYLTSSRFWFESFQNWQSEFLAIAAMVVLSIWLREKDSPESKDVATPHLENKE